MNRRQDFSKIVVIIPTYQPTQILLSLFEELKQFNYHKIIIIDDGSDKSCQTIFLELEKYPNAIILRHDVNKGKGAALKTGFEYVLKHFDSLLIGVVTVDGDGQHITKDINQISHVLLENPHSLILGVRTFSKDVPLRSRFGNHLTRKLFQFFFRMKIQDTQTGLRGIPLALLQSFLSINLNRYEYETVCLIQTAKSHYPTIQIPIKTVYIDQNKASHFNPIVDSIRIYFIFFCYAFRLR